MQAIHEVMRFISEPFMKVGRQYIGKLVEVRWRDPGTGHAKGRKREELPRGLAALAAWVERGVIDDITDGVIRVVHSEGRQAQHVEGVDELEVSCTWVPDDLVDSITVFEASKAPEP